MNELDMFDVVGRTTAANAVFSSRNGYTVWSTPGMSAFATERLNIVQTVEIPS
jgi:hypothetical protein